jgi:site-specific DNA-methyltransferase (cytosine-N4-specific)
MHTSEIDLHWHNYKFFPYEKRFALREVESLLKPYSVKEFNGKLTVTGASQEQQIKKLVYFSHAVIKDSIIQTSQFLCENGSGKFIRQKRQNTRYSVHGLHEYKGKFNPQVVRSLFNIYNVKKNDKILDPFCGSGTTIVEAAHDGVSAVGTDINPLAVFIANAKIKGLRLGPAQIISGKEKLLERYSAIKKELILDKSDLRIEYLSSWFLPGILKDIEALKLSADELKTSLRDVFLVLISNTLRDYSLQEPSDLRIRRRISPFPTISLMERISNSIDQFILNQSEFQTSFKPFTSLNKAVNTDIKRSSEIKELEDGGQFDFAITSPPYATALPYIDTQRLSLVWLNLISPKEIRPLESKLIGSREFNQKVDQGDWMKNLLQNKHSLPDDVFKFCVDLYAKLKKDDGFRKQALPSLLYRYFYDMNNAFKQVHRLLKKDKFFCLIVGHNHTNIGGKRTDIDTPQLLSLIGKAVGFKIHEILPLEAYQRYGLNSTNAVQQESLIVFKK